MKNQVFVAPSTLFRVSVFFTSVLSIEEPSCFCRLGELYFSKNLTISSKCFNYEQKVVHHISWLLLVLKIIFTELSLHTVKFIIFKCTMRFDTCIQVHNHHHNHNIEHFHHPPKVSLLFLCSQSLYLVPDATQLLIWPLTLQFCLF